MACIARSSEQQRAIYGITPMINGMVGSRHPSTLFSTRPPSPFVRSYSLSPSPLSHSLFSFSACPAAYVCGLCQRATNHWPTLGPDGLRSLSLSLSFSFSLSPYTSRQTVWLPCKKAYNVKPAAARADRISSIRPSVHPSVYLFFSSSCLLGLI